MIEFIYDLFLFYKSCLLGIVRIQTNNILIANDLFINNKKKQ